MCAAIQSWPPGGRSAALSTVAMAETSQGNRRLIQQAEKHHPKSHDVRPRSSLAPSGNASGSTIRRRGTRVCLGRRQGAAVPQALLAVDFMRSERHRAEEDAEFGSTTLPLNKDYSAQMSEVRITHPSVVFFFVVRRHRKRTTSGAIRPGRAACRTDEPEY